MGLECLPNEYLEIIMRGRERKVAEAHYKSEKKICPDERNASYHLSKFSLTIKAN